MPEKKARKKRVVRKHLPSAKFGDERRGWRAAPLSTTFMIASMVGFLISVVWLPKYSVNWAFAFGIVFFTMFVAAMISMARASPDEQLLPRPRKIK